MAKRLKVSSQWLKDVVAGPTTIAQVKDGSPLLYRSTNVATLVQENVPFEEVAFLLWNGELPKKDELLDFMKKERNYREISKDLLEVISKSDSAKGLVCVVF